MLLRAKKNYVRSSFHSDRFFLQQVKSSESMNPYNKKMLKLARLTFKKHILNFNLTSLKIIFLINFYFYFKDLKKIAL